MMFHAIHADTDWQAEGQRIAACTAADVERALGRAGRGGLDDFRALVSPAAVPYLEAMAQASARLTRQRFGRVIQLYVPVYLSNLCTNGCDYCGFSRDNRIRRTVLDPSEIAAEIVAVKAMGFDHVLLVTGEAEQRVGCDYLRDALRQCRPHFSNLCLEVQPLEAADYATLMAEGLHGVYLYQETYHRPTYLRHHRFGRKRDMAWRLDAPDRMGTAGVRKIGLGVLLGLEDWRVDSLCCAHHLRHLERQYWRTRFSISLPRLCPHAGGVQVDCPVDDAALVQLICAWRLFDADLEISLSTRESARLRDHLCSLGITAMSAASCTQPGGYAQGQGNLEQFAVDDDRSAEAVAVALKDRGLEPVWKDWDSAYDQAPA